MYIGTVRKIYSLDKRPYYVFITNDAQRSVYIGSEERPLGRYILDISDITKLPNNPFSEIADYKLEDFSKLHFAPKKDYDTFVFKLHKEGKNFEEIARLISLIRKNNPEACFVFQGTEEKIKTLRIRLPFNEFFAKTEQELINYIQNRPAVLAFANDEEEALIYTELQFDIVFLSQQSLLPNVALFFDSPLMVYRTNFFSKDSFRYNMIYSYRPLSLILHNSHSNEQCKAFHEENLVVYHSRYYKQEPPTTPQGRICRETLSQDFFRNKKEYVENHLDELIEKDFSFLFPDSSTLFLKVPGHDPMVTEDAMSVLLKGFSKKFGAEYVLDDCLVRTKKVSSAKETNERGINKNISSLDIKEEYKDILKDKTIFLFDDVCTTGSSFFASSEILYKYKVRHVVCFSIACTGPNFGFDGDFLQEASRIREIMGSQI